VLNQDFEYSHQDLVELTRAGNQLAMYQLYHKYARAMYNICYRMMNNREEAEDMLQEAFTEAFRKIESFTWESTFGAWLRRIVVNRCINAIRKKKIEIFYAEDIEEHDLKEDEIDYHGIDLEVEKVKKAISKLPDGFRVVFSLYALEGYDHTEIADIVGITESTSKSQYMRAKQKLAGILNEQRYE
jgi:RNA polymerase sigma factor (sigma-70 family)